MQTKGWDTISIVRQDSVNSDMAASWTTLNHEFSYASDEGYACHGVFDCWSVINGGGGRLLRLRMPIRSGFFEASGISRSLAGAVAIIEVTLSLLPQGSGQMQLKSAFLHKAEHLQQMQGDDGGWLRGITLQDPSGSLGPYAAVVLDCICNYLVEHPAQFTHTFATINFSKSSAPEWVRPRKCTYAYLDSGFLAIMAVCTERDIGALPLDIDVSGISEGGQSCYVLSARMVLEHLILPGLLQLYQGANPQDYRFDETQMVNIPALRMQAIKSGLIWYTPIVFAGRNPARILGDVIAVDYQGDCDLYAGIDMNWNGWLRMKLVLDGNTVHFVKQSSDFKDQVDIPWYLAWLSPVVSLITHIVTAFISDDLISAIAARGGSVKADTIDCVSWSNTTHTAQSSYLAEALVIKYV
ncbi:TULIP family P47-like protein [Pseudomonas sp. KB_15]|uniref:TULIP family P47-like protein n=1 Tax=Pseudomonas sp. KB_15 TaxID=3233035 RepID=UPI003F95EFC8